MHNCNNGAPMNRHTNAFVDLHGIPYLLAEYMDKRSIMQLDRSLIRSEINVDTSECMRAVVNISVDDIGLRASDGLPAVWGNNRKQMELLKMIENRAPQLDHVLDVMRRGIVIRVNYALENASTGITIRTMSEDFRILNRGYYMDINPRNVNDNAIIINFAEKMMSTITEFTHGRERMQFRINSIEMFYEVLPRVFKRPGSCHNVCSPGIPVLPTCYGQEEDFYNHHHVLQSHHILGDPSCGGCDDFGYGHEHPMAINPPGWTNFNRFYHFDHDAHDAVLHTQEIDDPRTQSALMPCGTVRVNRVFVVNPGHHIVFNFSIWKNDLTIVNDCKPIAKALNVYTGSSGNCDCNDHYNPLPYPPVPGCGEINPDNETLIRMLHNNMETINRQSFIINQMHEEMDYIRSKLENMDGCHHDCGCNTPTENGNAMVSGVMYKTLQDAIAAVESGDATGEITLMNNVEEELVITGDVTINLNGCVISVPISISNGRYHHTILVDGGNLTINGDGEVRNGNSQGYCIMNAGINDTWIAGGKTSTGMGIGTVTLNGGTYIHTGTKKETQAYVIVNRGSRMTINDGVKVDTMYDGSSLITNGYQKDPTCSPIMTINGGTFRGGRHTINNDHGGRMIIKDGVFRMGTPWVDQDFQTGPKNVLRNEEDSTAQITGGKFSGNIENTNETDGSLVITGGTFSVSVTKFVPDGYIQLNNGVVMKRD